MTVTLMQEISVDFGPRSPKILCVTAPVEAISLDQVQLADSDEVAKFATTKRLYEHLSGRLLLEQALVQWGIDTTLLEVRRNEFRAPSIAYMPGTWVRLPLPSISIGHSNGHAFAALIEPGWTIGIDAEPTHLKISHGVFDMIASGDELSDLMAHPDRSLLMWTAKEAIQKAARKGMHLNPRKIKIPIEDLERNIAIDNSIFQLRNLTFNRFNVSIAIGPGNGYDSIPEDELLNKTLSAMNTYPDWTVGCKTVRSNQ